MNIFTLKVLYSSTIKLEVLYMTWPSAPRFVESIQVWSSAGWGNAPLSSKAKKKNLVTIFFKEFSHHNTLFWQSYSGQQFFEDAHGRETLAPILSNLARCGGMTHLSDVSAEKWKDYYYRSALSSVLFCCLVCMWLNWFRLT